MVGLVPPARGAGLSEPGAPDRLVRLAAAAVTEALADAGWMGDADVGLVLGTTDTGGDAFERQLSRPCAARASLAATLADDVAAAVGLHGPAALVWSASASGAVAIGVAADLVRTGGVRRVVACGADTITRAGYFGLNSLRTLSPLGCRSFSSHRRGIRVSEGAGALALESVGNVMSPCRALLVGYGASGFAAGMTRPDSAGIRLALESCLHDAMLDPADVDYINLHGPGTRHGDKAELDALADVLADRLPAVLLNSSKPILGHCQGAAGAIEAIVAILAVEHAVAPPTHGLDDVDPAWAALDFVLGGPRPGPLRCGLSVSCGLGGLNAVVAFRPAVDA
jgi:3-oxoacyl-(acyl-carrier-protein) synthase